MHVRRPLPLLDWDAFEDPPELKIIQKLLDMLPDEELNHLPRKARGNGRNKYPVLICWRTYNVRFLLNHPSMQACLDEMGRNPALRRVVGIEFREQVPSPSAMSRFQKKLGEERFLRALQTMYRKLIQKLELLSNVVDEQLGGPPGRSCPLCRVSYFETVFENDT